MKKLLFLSAIFCTLQTNAQTYSISFSGTGLSSVKVDNLTAVTSIIITSGQYLRLNTLTGINSNENRQLSELKIYPNPMTDNSILQVYPAVAGNAAITVYDMNGKLVEQIQSYLENYLQEFRVSGLNSGLYLISVKGSTYQYSVKLLCNSKAAGTIRMEKISNTKSVKKEISKSGSISQDPVDMVYHTGDRLKYTAVSGNNKTVITDIPTSDKTVTFTFTECKDGDNNYYPVVQINTQLWMAENLKTTKYKDGSTSITNVTVNGDWAALTTPGYCWYGNNLANKDVYGALYNWYVVTTGNVCPTGWHVPTDADWTILTTYLGGISIAGSKMKETGNTHWSSQNTDATNESGFTVLPSGARTFNDGTFELMASMGVLWSGTAVDADHAWNRSLHYDATSASGSNANNPYGFSVRCVKD